MLELGKQLASELDPSDVLGRWMSHHIAELIARAESARADEQPAVRRAAADAITNLWASRHGAPWRRRPLRDFQPIFDALERLMKAPSQWGYYRVFDEDSRPTAEETANDALLAAACKLEAQAHRIVRSAVAVAAREAEAQEAAWVTVGLEIADDQDASALRSLKPSHPQPQGPTRRPHPRTHLPAHPACLSPVHAPLPRQAAEPDPEVPADRFHGRPA